MMRLCVLATATLACVVTAASCRGEQVLWERRGDGYAFQGVLIDAEQPDHETIEAVARSRLREFRDSDFVVVRIYPRTDEIPGPRLPLHRTFSMWRAAYERYAGLEPRFAEAVSVGENAILRWRGVSGEQQRVTLRGDDPLTLKLEHRSAEILHFGRVESPEYGLHVFVKVDGELDVALGGEILGALRRRLPTRMTVFIREDSWFIDGSFPYGLPFEAPGAPPSVEAWERSVTVICYDYGGEQPCESRRGSPDVDRGFSAPSYR